MFSILYGSFGLKFFYNKSKTLNVSSEHKSEETAFYNMKKDFERDGQLIHVSELLHLAYKKYPNKVALISDGKQITYKEFYFRSALFAKKMQHLGVNPRDKILLCSGNSIDFYIAYFAIWMIGAVIVPVNIFLHEKEFAYVVSNSDAKAIFVSNDLKSKFDVTSNTDMANLDFILDDSDIDWESKVPKEVDFKVTTLPVEELALILYTSGTTGKPKGVMLSSKNIITNSLQDYARLMFINKSENDRFFSVLPLFHVFAQNTCMWLPVMAGAAAIIVKKIDRKLIMQGLTLKPTLFFGFPALYGLLCLLKTAPLDSVRMFVSGADAMPDKIRMAFALIYGRKICAGYGLTEAAPVIAVNHENESLATHYVGYPLNGVQCDIRDDAGNSLSRNNIGTLWVKGDNIMMGYYKSQEETDKVLVDGWLNTGDLGSINSQGYLSISGRNKDLIIHKGFNIYPQEVENILLSHPKIMQAAVIGKEDSSTGQIPIAFVALKGKEKISEGLLRELCAANLANYKIPKKFIYMDSLPMNATGKIDKKILQQY